MPVLWTTAWFPVQEVLQTCSEPTKSCRAITMMMMIIIIIIIIIISFPECDSVGYMNQSAGVMHCAYNSSCYYVSLLFTCIAQTREIKYRQSLRPLKKLGTREIWRVQVCESVRLVISESLPKPVGLRDCARGLLTILRTGNRHLVGSRKLLAASSVKVWSADCL
jgi:hypothetical protein